MTMSPARTAAPTAAAGPLACSDAELCAAAGVAASVLSVDRPEAALAVALVALPLAIAELGPIPVLRRLTTYRRATQNVLSAAGPPKPVTLILVAATGRPRAGLLRRARIPGGAGTVAAL